MSSTGIHGGIKKQEQASYFDAEKRFATDPDLVREYGSRLGLNDEDAKFLINQFVESFRYVINKNVVVNVRNLGVFNLKVRKRCKMYNPRTGEHYMLPLHYTLKFVSSASLRAFLNGRVRANLHKAYDIGESI